uniref:RNA1 polyprotein n=1 Tax=Carrot torradovirus 1 TaxID=1425364 RepID=A0A3T1B9Z5_9SECO|nr:polyprotein [Carrot torradovirus 1]
MSFSTLRNLPKNISQFGSDVGDLVSNVNKCAQTINGLEGPFHEVLLTATNTINKLENETLPVVNEMGQTVTNATSRFSSLFDKLETLIKPLLSINEVFVNMWSSVSKLLLSIFNKRNDVPVASLMEFFTDSVPEDMTLPLVVVLGISSLVLMSYLVPNNLLQMLLGYMSTIFVTIKGFIIGLMPNSWVSKWFDSYSGIATRSLQAQAPAMPVASEIASPSFSDTLTSIVSIGFVSILYCIVGTGKPGRKNANPISEILCAAGDHASKANQLFTFFRNVKTTLGETIMWVGEWLCEVTGFASPLTATINVVLNTKLFEWFNQVNEVTSPQHRSENFASPNFASKAALLKDQVPILEAEFAKYPVSPFVSTRFHYAVAKLDKILHDATAHKGVGQFRQEPFCIQFYGKPGCGKTTTMNYFITDLLNKMGEPKVNRLYSLSSKDGYWSNYNHQIAVLIDDFGQILDSANQHDDVKDFIFMKSCAPMSLSMAAVEEKGTQFTSRYIFLTSNFPTPARTAGVMEIEAVQRHRDVLVRVERSGPLSIDATTPVDNVTYTICDSKSPFRPQDEYTNLTYFQLLDVVENKCRQHITKDSWLKQFNEGLVAQAGGIEEELIAQAAVATVSQIAATRISKDMLLSSLKMAYTGSLDFTNPFPAGTLPNVHFDAATQDIKVVFAKWQTELLHHGIKDSEVNLWSERIDEEFRRNFMAWINEYDFNESGYFAARALGTGSMQDFIESEDPDAMIELRRSRPISQFAFALIVRNFCALKRKAEKPKETEKLSYVTQVINFIREKWERLPLLVRTMIKYYAFYRCTAFAFDTILSFLSPASQNAVYAAGSACIVQAEARGSGKGNVSGDESTHRGGSKSKQHRFLTAQCSLSDDWSQWAAKDPFLNDSLIKNMVVLRLPQGGIFRGVYVRSGWLLTVGHAFAQMADGAVFTVIHQHSVSPVAFDKRTSHYKILEEKDLCLIYVGDIDGLKKDIVGHFAKRGHVMCSVGSKAVLAKPTNDEKHSKDLISLSLIGVSMLTNGAETIEYQTSQFTRVSVSTLSFQFPGQDGDCGSLLMLPAIGNRQPVICGVHCAGKVTCMVKQGYVESFASVIFQEDLLPLLPEIKITPQGPCPLLRQLRKDLEDPFEVKQVALLGQVPAELSVSVPHKTTLRQSELFNILEEEIGPHLTEPSLLIKGDRRCTREGFDPYIAGVQKFNETANCFDMAIAESVMEALSDALLAKLRNVQVPGDKPSVRTEMEVLNGIPGEKFYDSMDFSTSCGYPFMIMGHGKSKREFLDGEPGDYMLARDKPVYEEYMAMDDAIMQGIAMEMVTCECAKDERLPLEKIYEKPKTRLFTILPFHYNMLVRKYFLDFSASLMRAHNDIPCKVGINPEGLEWTTLANGFMEKSRVGFSADYSSFDGRAPVFIFQWFCDMVDKYYGDVPGSANSLARHALLMMASNHYTLCGDKLFRVVGGMPSGFSLTVLFNSLLNEFYMRYAFEVLLRHPTNAARAMGVSQKDFEQLFVAIYGDDNLVAVPFHMQWYSLPAIAKVLEKVNVVIKNGLDKGSDVADTEFLPLGELTFLSRGFKRHSTGYMLAPLKWVSVVEPLRWIRPSAECPAVDALLENVNGALRAAFMHGEAQFKVLKDTIIKCLSKRMLPTSGLPTYLELERDWLREVSGMRGDYDCVSVYDGELNTLPENGPLSRDEYDREVNEFAKGIYFCSARTAKHLQQEKYIIVNCLVAQHKSWIRGPNNWRDLENKIWAYTMSAIETEVRYRMSQNKSTDLLFVCPGGTGMSLVCAALATLASNAYSKAQVVRRLRKLTGSEKLSAFAGGAGHYLLLAAQAGGKYQDGKTENLVYGNNLFDRCLRIGNCCVITGCVPPSTNPVALWCTPTSGYAGVKTCHHFIKSQDPRSQKLAKALRDAKRDKETLFLFFSHFRCLEAEWVLNGLRQSGSDTSELLSSDLLLMERQARIVDNSAFGKISLKIVSCWKKKTVHLLKLWESGDSPSKPIPLDATCFATPTILSEHLAHIKDGIYHTFSVLDALKLLVVCETSVSALKDNVRKFFPGDTLRGDELVIMLGFWTNCSTTQISNMVSALLLQDYAKEFEYVSHSAPDNYWVELTEFENSYEELNLMLKINYIENQTKGHKVFSLPREFSTLAYLLAGYHLENEVRRKRKEKVLDLPLWYPQDHPVVNKLGNLVFNYI